MVEKRRETKDRLVLIDGHSVLFRAFHAYPPLTTKSGELVNAVYGFTNILLSVIKDLEPTHIAVSFDLGEPTFRHKEFSGYKASRPEAPEELIAQQDRVVEMVKVLNIPIFSVPGFEADDVIGTLARQAVGRHDKIPQQSGSSHSARILRDDTAGLKSVPAMSKERVKENDVEVVIVTGDRDALQLVDNERVFVYSPGRGRKQPAQLWDARAVEDKYGLIPQQLIDFKALAGDSSDEIPGVKGIGPKKATALLKSFKDIDGIFKNLEKVKEKFGKSVWQKLADGKDSAYLSRRLATIVTDIPIELSLRACEVHDYDKAKAIERFEELEFKSLIMKLPKDNFEQMIQEELF